MSKRILFVCLPSTVSVFKRSKIAIAVPMIPLVSLAQLSACLKQEGHETAVLDLSIKKTRTVGTRIIEYLRRYKPDYVGITFTTPLDHEATRIARFIKRTDPGVIIVAGGPHPSIATGEVVASGAFDIVVSGEGEQTLVEILNGVPLERVRGIGFLKDGQPVVNPDRELVQDLDTLPMPDYSIYELRDYHVPRLNSRRNPVAAMETSRGCVFNCLFCSKHVFKQKFRAKSPARVVDEMLHLARQGFREIHVWDDGFSTNVARGKDICKEIIRRRLTIPWNIYNGIRVDRLDEELFRLLKAAGCYRVALGVESGSQEILDRVHKSVKISQIIRAFKMARDAGLETVAFCVFGFPGETTTTMNATIQLMNAIRPTIPKLSFFMPLPGTEIFEEWDRQGIISSKDWRNYIYHLPDKVYNHPTLDWETLSKYYNLFYRKTMLNPRFIARRFINGIRTGSLPFDLYYFVKTLRWGW